ncbi:hypothetical protein, partial [Algoriphagus terrigena]|uniref:hypothetical protein n=1 Tax=Algoriphagus terrigena TaxID=344884 RepID=UPI003CCB8693
LQSHHTGIEISDRRILQHLGDHLQSHHTGIEIVLLAVQLLEGMLLQSHHTGIEIGKGETNKNDSVAFNRTILEFKLECEDPEPEFFISLNRAILELKLKIIIWIMLNLFTFNRTIPELK